MNIADCISQFIEDTRDDDGSQSFVWLADRGVLVHIDTCTDLALVSAANEWLASEIDRLNAERQKVQLIKAQMGVEQ